MRLSFLNLIYESSGLGSVASPHDFVRGAGSSRSVRIRRGLWLSRTCLREVIGYGVTTAGTVTTCPGMLPSQECRLPHRIRTYVLPVKDGLRFKTWLLALVRGSLSASLRLGQGVPGVALFWLPSASLPHLGQD